MLQEEGSSVLDEQQNVPEQAIAREPAAEIQTPLSLFEKAWTWDSKPQNYPLLPAGAPTRPAGSIGPVLPTTLGLHEQVRAMMLSAGPKGAFQSDLELSRRMLGQLSLTRGDRFVGLRGHVTNWTGTRVKSL